MLFDWLRRRRELIATSGDLLEAFLELSAGYADRVVVLRRAIEGGDVDVDHVRRETAVSFQALALYLSDSFSIEYLGRVERWFLTNRNREVLSQGIVDPAASAEQREEIMGYWNEIVSGIWKELDKLPRIAPGIGQEPKGDSVWECFSKIVCNAMYPSMPDYSGLHEKDIKDEKFHRSMAEAVDITWEAIVAVQHVLADRLEEAGFRARGIIPGLYKGRLVDEQMLRDVGSGSSERG